MKEHELLVNLYKYKKMRSGILRMARKLEKGEFYSPTLRSIFSRYHGVNIGMYTYGGCFNLNHFDRNTTIGRYCSVARTAFTMNRNHPMNTISTHAFFFNSNLGFIDHDASDYIPLEIGHDVWIGHNSVILPSVKRIGNGAVIGAGSIVTKDVPSYAIVAGNPAHIIKYRFSVSIIEKLMESQWWLKPIDQIKNNIEYYTEEITESNILSYNPIIR